jgi:hypothetical protein
MDFPLFLLSLLQYTAFAGAGRLAPGFQLKIFCQGAQDSATIMGCIIRALRDTLMLVSTSKGRTGARKVEN